MSGPYDDILGLKRPPSRHPAMAMEDRAAQFAPFAALNGHEEAVLEAARYTEGPEPLGEAEMRHLDSQLAWLREHMGERPKVRIRHFVADGLKEGGTYETVSGSLRAVDDYHGWLVFQEGVVVALEDIAAMDLGDAGPGEEGSC